MQYGIGGRENWHVHGRVVRVGQPDHAVGAVVSDVPVAVQRDQAPVSGAVGEVEGRPEDGAVGDRVRGRSGGGHQFGVHEIVHVLAVLAVLPGKNLLDGPRGREVRDTAIPRTRDMRLTSEEKQKKSNNCEVNLICGQWTYFLLRWHILFPSPSP